MRRLCWFALLALPLIGLLSPGEAEAGCVFPLVAEVGSREVETEFGTLRFSQLQMQVSVGSRRKRRLEKRPALARALLRRKGTVSRGVLSEPLEIWTPGCDATFPAGTVVSKGPWSETWEFSSPEPTVVCERRVRANETVALRPTYQAEFTM